MASICASWKTGEDSSSWPGSTVGRLEPVQCVYWSPASARSSACTCGPKPAAEASPAPCSSSWKRVLAIRESTRSVSKPARASRKQSRCTRERDIGQSRASASTRVIHSARVTRRYCENSLRSDRNGNRHCFRNRLGEFYFHLAAQAIALQPCSVNRDADRRVGAGAARPGAADGGIAWRRALDLDAAAVGGANQHDLGGDRLARQRGHRHGVGHDREAV